MKPEELMIGDLVMASTYDEELDDEVFHPARLTAISSIQELFDGNWDIEWLDDCESESVADLEPIPLTEEILNLNGAGHDCGGTYFEQSEGVYIYIGITDGESCISVTDFDEPIVFVKYVHELQHALRLCGLTELENNLKIE